MVAWSKGIKVVCMLCAMILCSSFCSAANAEDYGIETKSQDLQRIEWAMAMTAEIAGNSLERTEEAETVRQRSYLAQFAQTPYLSPDKAIVLEFSEDQAGSVKAALGMESSSASANWEDVGPALAELINQQFSADYTQAARLTQAEGETTIEYSRYFTIVLLFYGNDISVTSLTGWGHINSRAAMIISTRDISSNLAEKDVALYIQKLGLDMPLVRIYEKNDLDRMITEDPWGTGSDSFQKMMNALLSSEKRRETLLLAWMQSESPSIHNRMKLCTVVSALRSMETADQTFVRDVAQNWLPALTENSENPVSEYLSEGYTARAGKIVPPAIVYGNELHETELKADGTFLTVFDLTVPDKDTVSWYDVILEAALPADRIPDAVDAADYIIRCSVTYEGGISKGDAHLHYPLTHITVHDAHTGEMIQDLGYYKRRLTGTIMLGSGDTWWDPLYTELWLYIRKLFT